VAYVLLLEDNELNTKLVTHLLRMRGHELECAPHAVTVMRKALRRRPDLVITGVQQPGVSGLAFIRWVRTTPEIATVPIFVCTAYGVGEDVRVLASGPDAYLRLPLTVDSFTAAVDALLDDGRKATVARILDSNARRRPVLLIPAQPGSLALPAANLRRLGREVIEAASPREAAALASGRRFDALVTDTDLHATDFRDGRDTGERSRWMHVVETVIRWTDPLNELNDFLARHPDWREDTRWAA